LGTFFENIRSIAYLTSLAFASRLTGGLNLIPVLVLMVIVLPPLVICG